MGRTDDRHELDVIDVEPPARGAPPRSRAAAGRGPRRLRQASLMVAAAVIVVGVVASGGLLGESRPTNPPEAVATDETCRELEPAMASPAFRLAGAPDDERGVRGLPGERRPKLGATNAAWQVPGAEQSLTISAPGDLHLILATGACAVEVEVEAAPAEAGDEPPTSDRQQLLRTALEPPRHAFAFPAPADGDWVLRVVVAYLGADTTGDDEHVAEWFFRVRVGAGPFATPSLRPVAIATPAMPCGLAPSVPADAVVTLATRTIDPVSGVASGEVLPEVVIGLGETIEIAVAGAACATSWTIEARAGEAILSIEGVLNDGNDPARASQNVWQFRLPDGSNEAELVVILRFGSAGLVERLWQVRSAPFQAPPVFVVAADGRRVAADPGCGLGLERANGFTAGDGCNELGYEPGERLTVDADEPLGLEIEGWTIVAWSGSCGSLVESDEEDAFEPSGCSLGGFDIQGFEGSGNPPPIRFVLPAGDHVLQLWITATLDGDRFSVPYFAGVLAR
ncbi:MAG: hypothetical protein L0227_09115 [Chloroflexi bacterium]|nr:hypothetical protein [Chloroflexota bacterium]